MHSLEQHGAARTMLLGRERDRISQIAGLCRPPIITAVWGLLLVVVSTGELLPGDAPPIAFLSEAHFSDTVMHFAAFAALAFIPTFGLRPVAVFLCLFGTELTGIALEFAQAFIPGRSCDYRDVLANSFGLLSGTVAALVIRSRLNRARQRPMLSPLCE
jgi:VanZ family protein